MSLIQQQGMLSVPLLHRQAAEREHYALLNGAKNNLCLDGNLSEQSEWYRKMAWSSGNMFQKLSVNVLWINNYSELPTKVKEVFS